MTQPTKARSWEEHFRWAQIYHEQHGHLLMKRDFMVEGVSLGRWICSQRERKAANKLLEDQITRLDSLGMVWNVRDHYWTTMYQAAKAYYTEHKNLEIPRGYLINGCDLSRWIHGYRARRQTLSQDKKEKLEQIGMVWDQRSQHLRNRWDHGHQYACAFYQRNGHLYVPEKHQEADGYTLGRWIRAQRVHYQNHTLSAEHILKLEQIGMLWRVDQRVQTSFHEQTLFYYLRLLFPNAQNRDRERCGCELDIFIPELDIAVEFDSLRFHGPAQVEKDLLKNAKCRGKVFLIRVRHRGCPILGVNDQFVHYITYDDHKNIEPALLTFLQLLRDRFDTDISSISVEIARDYTAISEQLAGQIDYVWSKKLADAKDFWLEYHHLDIPYGHMVGGYNLGSWLQDQRKAYSKKQLLQYKIKALEAMGIKWHYLEETWQSYYSQIKERYALHGDTAFRLAVESERSLYYWKNDQIKMLREKRMDAKRAKLLSAVGITAAYAHDENFAGMCRHLRQYREENGHSVVPINFCCADGTPLGKWMQRQRGFYQCGKLAEDRVKALMDLGFCPHHYEHSFERWMELLKRYRQEHGHIRVPQSYTMQGERLGKFINKMRVNYRRGELSPQRIRRLEELGMVWYIPPGSASKER